jgi:hypothetical protein
MAAAALPAVPLILEAIKDTLIVVGIIGGGAVVADQIDKANQRAKDESRDAAPSNICQRCQNNPCAALAGGVPGTKYKGGAHAIMKGPVGDGLDSHHMPSADASAPFPRDMGPAIKMDPEDYRETASYGSSPAAVRYRATQRKLIQNGNFTAAFAMDVADIRSQFGSKYDGAIAQATAYMQCLKKHGLVR